MEFKFHNLYATRACSLYTDCLQRQELSQFSKRFSEDINTWLKNIQSVIANRWKKNVLPYNF